MKNKDKNQLLENHKRKISIKKGYKSWNDLRLNTDLKDCFIILHEACENAINENKNNLKKHYENQINNLKKTRKETKLTSLQDEIRRCFPMDRVG